MLEHHCSVRSVCS